MTTKPYRDALNVLQELCGPLTFGRMLGAIRLGDELTQLQFAKKLKISTQNLSDIEHGRRSVSPEKAYFFAKKLGYSPEQFVRLALQDLIERSGLHDLQVTIEKKAS